MRIPHEILDVIVYQQCTVLTLEITENDWLFELFWYLFVGKKCFRNKKECLIFNF